MGTWEIDIGTLPGGPTRAEAEASEERFNLLAIIRRQLVQFDLFNGVAYEVGRSLDASIQLDDRSVSRLHAKLVRQGDGVSVEDLESSNGTYVNGARLGPGVVATVSVGDVLRFGNVVTQLKRGTISRAVGAIPMTGQEFDQLIEREAARMGRSDRTVSIVAVQLADRNTAIDERRLDKRLLQCVRSFGAVTKRGPGRFDLLAYEPSLATVEEMTRQAVGELGGGGTPAAAGIASFPRSVPSLESLSLAAQLALHGTAPGEVTMAEPGTRRVKLPSREIFVSDPKMLRLFGLVERASMLREPALIEGETGTGKEMIAEALHALGTRVQGPLIKVNCAAIPEALIESELFGHEKGAFTGANGERAGLFEQAHGGTLFLDEIGEMPLHLQAKLLRVLDDGQVRRIGGAKARVLDVRVVAATHRNLLQAVEEERFRLDLYHRISGIVLRVPPLRERPREICELARRFVEELCEQSGSTVPELSEEALDALCSAPWPGNIRELRNALSAALLRGVEGVIEPEHLQMTRGEQPGPQREAGPRAQTQPSISLSEGSLEDELKSLERTRIVQALEATGFNQTRAAELLQMPRRTLVYKLRSLEIEVPRRRRPKLG